MTDRYYVERKAEDLHMGDMYVSWFRLKEFKNYPAARRILNIVATPNEIRIYLDDASALSLKPGQYIVVEELA